MNNKRTKRNHSYMFKEKMMSEIEKATQHMLKIVEILRGLDKRLNNLEGNKMNTEGLDLQQLTEEVASSIKDNVASEVASCIDLGVLADKIDKNEIVTDVAEYFGADGIAEHVDTSEVAEHINIDYKKLCETLITKFMATKECK
tara:strand:- start:40 stop:471 length:432 start_codon:yes stop_codon:yes gene_type:complete